MTLKLPFFLLIQSILELMLHLYLIYSFLFVQWLHFHFDTSLVFRPINIRADTVRHKHKGFPDFLSIKFHPQGISMKVIQTLGLLELISLL